MLVGIDIINILYNCLFWFLLKFQASFINVIFKLIHTSAYSVNFSMISNDEFD